MSYNILFKRLSAEASRMKRREVQLQLSRFVETFQVVQTPTESDLPDLYKFLQLLTVLSRQEDFVFLDKELSLLTSLYAHMRRDTRLPSLLGPLHLAEMLLLQARRRVLPIVFARGKELPNVIDVLSVLLPPCTGQQAGAVVTAISRVLASPVANMQAQLDVLLVCHKFLADEGGVPDEVTAALLNHVLQALRLPGMMQAAQAVSLRHSSAKEANRRRTSDRAATELDGTDCIDRFTLLNLATVYTPEQLVHMEVFAVLRRWLLTAVAVRTNATKERTPGRRDFLDEVISRLREDATELVQRLFDQCDRPVGRQTAPRDLAVQESVLLEAVGLLDLLVKLEPGVVTRLYPRCLALFEKHSVESARGDMPAVLVRLMDFLVAHCASMGVLPERFLEVIYGQMLTAGHFADPLFVDELMRYTLSHLEELCWESRSQCPLRRFFPNLWKVLAWNPRSCLARFLDILPAFLGEGSALENLHTILDLPCLAAALEFKRSLEAGETSPEQKRTWQRLHRHADFLLRAESGRGDTLDRMQDLYDGLSAFERHPRVLFVCDTVTPLLTVYFKVVLEFAAEETLSDLLPILLDRSLSLFGPPEHRANVQESLGAALQALVSLRPSLATAHEADLIDHVSKMSHIDRAPAVHASVLCLVGKAAIPPPGQRPNEDTIRRFYEAVECLTYELLSDSCEMPRHAGFPFWCTVALTLAKLAAQLPDFAPRCLLCLSKIRQQAPRRLAVDEAGRRALNQRVGEVSQLLRNPNIGPHVLCPRPDVLCEFAAHRDPRSLASALKEVDRRMTAAK